MGLDIHHYGAKYERSLALVRESELSARNKELILAYHDACLLQQTCGRVRLIRVLGVLVRHARALGKDFDTATRDDLQRLVTSMLNQNYTAETIGSYKAVLKRFYTFLDNPGEFGPKATVPPIVRWITTHVRERDKHRLERHDLLLPAEIQRVLAICHNPRDQALVSTMWETGGRIAELGNLEVRHVTRAAHGFTLDLNGKTGRRSILVIGSAPHLAAWLNNHPFRQPSAPLWVHYQYADHPRHIGYQTIRKLLVLHFRRAGITKRIYPHLFRHSRATYVLASGLMTEAQAKAYFGWTPSTDMLSTYAHLLASDANNAILRENNFAPTATQEQKTLGPRACTACNTLNNPDAAFCTQCTSMLDERRAILAGECETARADLLRELCTLIVERGLADDVARLVKRAGLGRGLATLADAERSSSDHAEASTPRASNLAYNDAFVQRPSPLKRV